MKRVINILCLGILLTAVACSEETPNIPPFVGSGEEALETGFFEDFTESTVDATKWAICPANQYANWKKFMGQIPLESYVPVDGVLSLQAVSPAEYGQPATNAPFCMGLQTMKPSGLVLYAFRYGEVTVRARFSSAGDGAWPAIWLMPVDENSTTWPEAGEIDIDFDAAVGTVATFAVDVSSQGKLNMAWNTTFDKDFGAMYDYANLSFINFEGEPSFNKNGTMYIYAEDKDTFVYEVTEDGAKEIKGLKWDEDYEAWTFKTRKLESYVISDVELDEKTVTEDKDDTTDDGKVNPDTGR